MDEDELPEAAAARELEEQTGFHAELEHLATVQAAPEVVASERVVFVGRDGERVAEPVTSEPVACTEWIPVKAAVQLMDSGELWDSSTALALLRASSA